MKINLIGKSFDKDSGQGIYRYSAELLEGLKREEGVDVFVNSTGEINHVQQPELIWEALFKKNVVTTFHDVMPIFNNERRLSFRLFFYVSALLATIKSQKIIAVSNCTRKDLENYFPWTKKKTKIIYEGIDQKIFFPNKKENQTFTIGYIGGLGKRKNVKFILELANLFPDIKFKIAGKGKGREVLEKIQEENNLKNVRFIGFVEDNEMKDFYSSLDLFLFPSFYEGFGLPVLEAMACGTPVLVSSLGSLPEIVPNKEFVMDITNLKATLEKINKLKKNRKTLNRLSQQGIKRSKFFNLDKTIKYTIKIYEELCC